MDESEPDNSADGADSELTATVFLIFKANSLKLLTASVCYILLYLKSLRFDGVKAILWFIISLGSETAGKIILKRLFTFIHTVNKAKFVLFFHHF